MWKRNPLATLQLRLTRESATKRTELLDSLKYISLDRDGDWWLTLSGDIRERYEYFQNYNWGTRPAGPQRLFAPAVSLGWKTLGLARVHAR